MAATLSADALKHIVDAAYRAKYSDAGSAWMVTPSAAATTLRLDPLG